MVCVCVSQSTEHVQVLYRTVNVLIYSLLSEEVLIRNSYPNISNVSRDQTKWKIIFKWLSATEQNECLRICFYSQASTSSLDSLVIGVCLWCMDGANSLITGL